jgi:hypothetical protein
MVRGGVEPPTFRFSGVADGQVLGCCQRVDGCRGEPVVVVGGRRCRHRCRQRQALWFTNDGSGPSANAIERITTSGRVTSYTAALYASGLRSANLVYEDRLVRPRIH